MTRAVALLLTVLTGFSGLVYEVTWQKCLAILLGSHSEATAAVLGIYLGGLALGYSLFGGVASRLVARAEQRGRPPRLLLAYGVVESGIGVWALAFPSLFAGVQALSLALPHTAPGVAFAIDVVLTALLIGPPTVLMGGTIPILTQALAHDLSDATRVHAHVYAFNTAGAFAGALAAGFVLIPWLGIEGVLYRMAVLNLFAGLVFGLLGLRAPRAAPLAPAAGPTAASVPGFALYAAVALLLGFAMMATQTALIRIGGLAFGASHYTFSMVVAIFVLCIALGSFAVSALPRIPVAALYGCVWGLGGLLGLLYLVLDSSPYYAHVLRTFFASQDAAFYPFHLAAFLLILGVLALPVGLSGASLPLLFHHLRDRVGNLGGVAGRLYSWNTVGSLLGALLGGYALLFFIDLHAVYRIGVGAVLVAATLLTLDLVPAPRRRLALGAGGASLLVLALLPAWSPLRLSAGLFRTREPMPASYAGAERFFEELGRVNGIAFYRDDPSTSVAVIENHTSRRLVRSIRTNGKSEGSLGPDYPTMALLAHIPCLVARQCRSSFVVGYGTGVTAGELASLDGMDRVLVAEISSAVVEAAPLFEYGNQQALANPATEIRRSDAYRALLRSQEHFDVIVSEPSNPWVNGIEMLYSQEFLRAARERLTPGGVYAQWMHLYETDDATLDLVLRTFASVFDRVGVWFTLDSDVVLLGFADGEGDVDLATLQERMERPDVRSGLRRAGIDSFPALLAHEVLPPGVLHALHLEGGVHTLLQPVLGQTAARAFFRGGRAELPVASAPEAAAVGARRSLLGRLLARGPRDDAFWADLAGELCEFQPRCPTALARWGLEHPGSRALAERIRYERSRPGPMREDLLPESLALLRGLFGDGTSLTAEPVHAADVRHATEMFARHYDPALPFDRTALATLLAACRGHACTAERDRAEALLGPLPGRPRSAAR